MLWLFQEEFLERYKRQLTITPFCRLNKCIQLKWLPYHIFLKYICNVKLTRCIFEIILLNLTYKNCFVWIFQKTRGKMDTPLLPDLFTPCKYYALIIEFTRRGRSKIRPWCLSQRICLWQRCLYGRRMVLGKDILKCLWQRRLSHRPLCQRLERLCQRPYVCGTDIFGKDVYDTDVFAKDIMSWPRRAPS